MAPSTPRIFTLAFAATIAGCTAQADDPTVYLTGTETLALISPTACRAGKELICHKPPGHRGARSVNLCVGAPAAQAHRRHHRDESGPCQPAPQPDSGVNDLCPLVRSGTLGGAGAACGAASACLSGDCAAGNCQAGAAGTPCENGADCVSGQCEVNCACAAGEPQGAGGACTVGNQCLSGVCVSAVCAPSTGGQACRVATDCQPPLLCVNGTCE
jgi:hypothetical protein